MTISAATLEPVVIHALREFARRPGKLPNQQPQASAPAPSLLCIYNKPLMHFVILDHAYMAKRRPAPKSKLARILDEAMEAHPDLKTQAALARKAGVAQSTISRMKRGEVDPQSENLRRVFAALSIPVSRFLDRSPEDEFASLAAAGAEHVTRKVPLMSLLQAGGFGKTADPYQAGDPFDWLLCPARCGPRTFALKVYGESMEPRYQNGDIIYVDPDVSPTYGSDVVVRLDNSNEATFKRLVIEGKRRYLKPLNPRFPIIEIPTEARIVGVVVAASWATTQTTSP